MEGRFPIPEKLFEEGFLPCNDAPAGWNRLVAAGVAAVQTEPGTLIAQVKEKFGGLRFYIHGGSEALEKYIGWLEDLSYKICQTCGKEGKRVNRKGWIATLCTSCAEEWLSR